MRVPSPPSPPCRLSAPARAVDAGGDAALAALGGRALGAALSGVGAALVEAIVANESGFDPRATSPAGAQGLMQLVPSTAAALGVGDAYDPAQNVRGGHP